MLTRIRVFVGLGFQFHKGTIRTRCRKTKDGKNTVFQFHKGTIRTQQQPDV